MNNSLCFLFFRCEDLEAYVKEVNPSKLNMILMNKADYLTENQRIAWASYFDRVGLKVAFFSAVEAMEDAIAEESEKVEGNQQNESNEE